jgi:hypothetical protein
MYADGADRPIADVLFRMRVRQVQMYMYDIYSSYILKKQKPAGRAGFCFFKKGKINATIKKGIVRMIVVL